MSNSEAASKKRGRPEVFPASLFLGETGRRLTRRQIQNRRWALDGVRLLMVDGKIPPEFRWLCDDERFFRVGILAELGRTQDRDTATLLARFICERKPPAKMAEALVREARAPDEVLVHKGAS